MKEDVGIIRNQAESIENSNSEEILEKDAEQSNKILADSEEQDSKFSSLSKDEVIQVRKILNEFKVLSNAPSYDEYTAIGDDNSHLTDSESDMSDDDYEEENESSQFFSRLNKTVLLGCIVAITVAFWICFGGKFLGIVFIIEIILSSIFALYITYKRDENIDLDELSDGLKIIEPNEHDKSLDEIIVRKPVEELKDLFDYVKNPKEFEKLGYTPETKVLLIGAADSGKNTIIKAFAHDTDLPIIRVNASRFYDTEDVIEKLFQVAKQYPFMKYIIQVDNFENIVNRDSSMTDDPETVLDTLNSYFSMYPNVILFATCEDPDIAMENIDIFERFFKKSIGLKVPEQEERVKLLKEFTSHLNLNPDVNIEQIAKNCYGSTIGALKYLVTIAASISRKHKHESILMSDFFEAFDSLEFGNENESYSEESKKIVAYHEAGHALVHYLKNGTKNLLRVISVGHEDFGGLTLFTPDNKKVVYTKEDLLNQICVSYGGRCAEFVIFGHFSTGASGDISNATSIISNMICNYGMSEKIGPINVAHKIALGATLAESEYILKIIAEERMRIGKKCEEETMKLLQDNRKKLDALATYLLEHKTIDNVDEFVKIIENVE